jgi:hypothetical protein
MPALKRCGDRVYFEFGIRRQSGSRLQPELFFELYLRASRGNRVSPLDLQSEPQAISDGSSPFFIGKAARRFVAAIIVVASEDQADGIMVGMAFVGTYFQAA